MMQNMRAPLFAFAVAASLIVSLGSAGRAQDTAAGGDAANGKKLFLAIGCYQCHGTIGQGGGRAGPRLAPNALPGNAIVRQLRHPAAYMPVYSTAVLSDTQANDLVAYLHSIKPGKAAKDIPLLNTK